ncbi:hypothetical protein GWI33_015613 [Rhynchophorus ferrugineus]|uniref:Uncharacterized protein n=1 Tax=Rhynchophorus ferrugineus TaxID=354439 RepID=A0A834I266_RHYFE|nr:hypothetical protein GWI33_015613 [Rhynchophorus ferrugineus]
MDPTTTPPPGPLLQACIRKNPSQTFHRHIFFRSPFSAPTPHLLLPRGVIRNNEDPSSRRTALSKQAFASGHDKNSGKNYTAIFHFGVKDCEAGGFCSMRKLEKEFVSRYRQHPASLECKCEF